jgi:aminocarboxymuconate-semialdehyde decarboxylase
MSGIETARLIDLHAHAVLDETLGAAGRFGPEMGADTKGVPWYRVGDYMLNGVRYRGSPFMDPEVRLARMDVLGIDFQMLSPNPLTYFHYIPAAEAIAFCIRHNDALARLVGRYPNRLAGAAALPMQDPVAAADELKRSVQELGLWAGYVGTDTTRPLDDPEFDVLYKACVALDVPLFLHPAPAGVDGPKGDPNLLRYDLNIVAGFSGQETIAIASLIFGGVLERHPELDICISNAGGSIPVMAARLAQAGRMRPWAPQHTRAPEAFMASLKRMWFDAHTAEPRALDLLSDLVGRDRLVYGTNFAGWDQPDSGELSTLGVELAPNARRLLRKGH